MEATQPTGSDKSMDIRASLPVDELSRSAEQLRLHLLDIENCFALFIGRKPEQEFVAKLVPSTVENIVEAVLALEEFKASVLGPALLREELPQSLLYEAPPFLLIDWVQSRLPVQPATSLAAGAARTWAQLLELLLADPILVALSPNLREAEIDSIFRERLEKEPLTRIDRSIIGAVDAASAFEVRGWAVNLCDKATPVVLEFFADNLFLGSATCGELRADVQDVVGGTGRCGFTFKVAAAHRAGFGAGRTLIAVDSISHQQIGQAVTVHADASRNWDIIEQTHTELQQIRTLLHRIEERLPEIGRKASIPVEAYGEYWERFYRLSPETLTEQVHRSARFHYKPKMSIIVPTWNSDTRLLHKAIESVRAQTYPDWELILSDDASGRDDLRRLWGRYAHEPRIRAIESAERSGISANTNRGIRAASGDYIVFLDHDDELSPDALYELVVRLQNHSYGLLYSDEDRIEEDEFGQCAHHTPFFKPAFDPDLLLSLNYICHLVAVRADLLTAIGGLRPGYEGAQDHDMLLRATSHLAASEVLHIPRILYHWRVTKGSVSQNPLNLAEIQKNITAAVADSLKHRGLHAEVMTHSDPVANPRLFATRLHWWLPSIAPKVSIIIATRDRVDLLRPCMRSVLDSITAYPGECEILIADNDSLEQPTLDYFANLSNHPQVRRVLYRGPFNWSAINNHAASMTTGEVLIFLNNDTVVLSRDWCAELAAHAMRADVGAVGARLLYADGTIQHAGVLLGVEGVAGHEGVGETPGAGGYFGRSQLLRSAAAVTGACLATRRALFEQMDGGFDELNLKVAFNDVDYCMKVRKAGYRVVYNPFAVLYHLESKSRGRELSEVQKMRHHAEALAFRARWTDEEMIDPYYNLHFERFSRPFERLRPPPQYSPSGELMDPAHAGKSS
jgi:GT2 family glycosyltransferase